MHALYMATYITPYHQLTSSLNLLDQAVVAASETELAEATTRTQIVSVFCNAPCSCITPPQDSCCSTLCPCILQVGRHAHSVCMCLCRYGDLEAIEDFIAIGRDINEGDPDGRTALHYAVVYDKQDVVKALIEAGVDLEKSEDLQNTPLHYACGYGRGMCVEILIDAGANTHATNNSGKTGLDLVK